MVASVVILTSGTPTKVLECLSKQTFKDFEIIIASEKGIVNAMNNALAKAKGEIFVRIDDDVELPPDWLNYLLRPFERFNVGGVTGPTFVPKELRANRDSIRMWEKPNWFFRWLRDDCEFFPAKIFKSGLVSYDSNYEERFEIICPHPFEVDHLEGTNWAMRTELIRRVGGFDPAFDGVAEWFDTDVEMKVKKLGFKLVYSMEAYMYHLLGKGEHFNERFDGWGRIKNFIKFHRRHSKFHPKMIVFLLAWGGYFVWKKFRS